MNQLKLKELLSMECKNKVTYEEVGQILNKSGITTEEYNNYVLEIFGTMNKINISTLKTNLLASDEEIKRASKSEPVFDQKSEVELRERLEKFYDIEMCPSFIMHDALLCKEDYTFLLEIYSDFYNLEHRYTEETANYFNNIMNMYFKRILDKCEGEVTIEKLKKIIKKL